MTSPLDTTLIERLNARKQVPAYGMCLGEPVFDRMVDGELVNPDGPEAADEIERLVEVERDRDEWKTQHENLLAIYQVQTLELLKRTELLRRSLAYLPSTYGLTKEIRAALPPEGPEDALTVALSKSPIARAQERSDGH